MGLILEQDRRPRDWAYVAAFRRRDLPSLQEMARQIRDDHNVTLLEDFNHKCEQKAQGRYAELVINDEKVEIQSVTKCEDLVTNLGLQICINLVLGTSSTRWQYMSWVAGVNPGTTPTISDTTLQGYAASPPNGNPIDMSGLFGWREAIGMKLFFGAIRAQSNSTIDSPLFNVGEIGVVTTNTGTFALLNRSKFINNALSPQSALNPAGAIDATVLILSAVIEFCPVT